MQLHTPRLKRGFTLIEILVSVAIISLLVTLLIPNVNRSLSGNNIASDADLLRSKIESARLLAGSTQQVDTGIGYYGVYLPSGSSNYFTIARFNTDSTGVFTTPCQVETVISQSQTGSGSCIVERITLSTDVTLFNGGNDKLILYRAPVQALSEGIIGTNGSWQLSAPLFSWGNSLQLKGAKKTGIVTIESYTGKLSVVYQ